jgi:Conjugative transposon protein TcpC
LGIDRIETPPMTMSRTWQTRPRWLCGHGGRIGRIAVVVAAVFGAAAGCKVFLAADHPDIGATAQRVANQQDQVGAFAADFVTTWLTATTAQRAALQRFITLADDALALSSTPAAVVTTPQVVSVIHTGSLGEADLFAATISVNERPYASAASTRAFYRVPVAMWHYQPRAVELPARVNGPGPGADITIRYRHALGVDSPVFAVASGFIHTYLTATTGLDRYALADSALTPVGGYQSAQVTAASADRAVADNAAPGTRIHVLANVVAQTTQFADVSMVYPLAFENSGGTWMVAAIDLAPQITEAEPNPVVTTHN